MFFVMGIYEFQIGGRILRAHFLDLSCKTQTNFRDACYASARLKAGGTSGLEGCEDYDNATEMSVNLIICTPYIKPCKSHVFC